MKLKIVFFFGTIIGLMSQSLAQCTGNTSFLGNDTSICDNQTINLSGPTGYQSYLWNTGSTSQSLVNLNAGTYTCIAKVLSTTNLVANGSFSLGNTQFSTGHVYGTGGAWGLLTNPGQYAISTNANLTHNNFPNCTDHTSGTGNYMIVNGSSVANLSIWCQTISVVPSTNYVFSAWLTSVISNNPAILNFTINGVSIGPNFNIGSTTCSWQNYFQLWTSGPTQTTATICITNQNTASSGNDFGLDDIYFAQECTNTDTVIVTSINSPVISLGPDTTICLGDSIILDATDSIFSTYLWSNASTIPSQVITSNSSLTVTVTTGGCSTIDSINIFLADSPIVNFGNDTTICNGASIPLSVTNNLSTYLWSTGSISNSINANLPNTYWGSATNLCGTDSDTITISMDYPLIVDIGTDTIICAGNTLTLHSNVIGDSYLWNNGSNLDSTLISSAFTYTLTVTNSCGNFLDSIIIDFEAPPITNLGPDSIYCRTNFQTLNATWSRSSYLWNTGNTTSSINTNTSGTYWVMVSNLCGNDSDTISLAFHSPIYFNLGPDTILCLGDSFYVSAPANNATWLWNDGSTDSLKIIHSAGSISVSASNQCGVYQDTINVTSKSIPVLTNLINDTIFCKGQSFTVNIDQNTAINIVWMDGNPNYQRFIYSSDTLSYSLKNICGSVSDTFIVTVDSPVEAYLGNDTIICFGEKVTKIFNYQNNTYLWSDGTTDSLNTFTQPGLYSIVITTPGLCETYSEFTIRPCELNLFIPNAFTPGSNDDLNNTFLIKGADINEFRIVIYDRWGLEVFKSFDINHSWDGTIQSKPAEVGIYSYRIWYNTGLHPTSIVRYGMVNLIK